MTRYTQLATRLSPREQVALVLVLQWLLYLASTIGSYYKWWVESNQGPGVYTFASTPIEDLEGPIKELQQECTWMDHKMSTESFAPSSPPANVSGSPSPESASGELQDAQEQNIMSGAALVRPATAAASTPVGPHPTHPTSAAPAAAAAPAPAPAPQHQARHPQPLPSLHPACTQPVLRLHPACTQAAPSLHPACTQPALRLHPAPFPHVSHAAQAHH